MGFSESFKVSILAKTEQSNIDEHRAVKVTEPDFNTVLLITFSVVFSRLYCHF